jgi:hypothetical protein
MRREVAAELEVEVTAPTTLEFQIAVAPHPNTSVSEALSFVLDGDHPQQVGSNGSRSTASSPRTRSTNWCRSADHIFVVKRGDGKRAYCQRYRAARLRANMLDQKGKRDDFANNIPHALRPTSRTGQGYHQGSLEAWGQGCGRAGRARPACAEFNPREDALNDGTARVRPLFLLSSGISLGTRRFRP